MFYLLDTDVAPFYSFYLYDQRKLPVTAFEILIQKGQRFKNISPFKDFPNTICP